MVDFVLCTLHVGRALTHPQTAQTHRGVSASSAKGTYRDTHTHTNTFPSDQTWNYSKMRNTRSTLIFYLSKSRNTTV